VSREGSSASLLRSLTGGEPCARLVADGDQIHVLESGTSEIRSQPCERSRGTVSPTITARASAPAAFEPNRSGPRVSGASVPRRSLSPMPAGIDGVLGTGRSRNGQVHGSPKLEFRFAGSSHNSGWLQERERRGRLLSGPVCKSVGVWSERWVAEVEAGGAVESVFG
jgi:hypothetical protein